MRIRGPRAMARITIVTPAGAGTRTGNRHTAQRWARLLRTLGHRVRVCVDWDGRAADVLLALHARRSHASIEAFARAYPERALVVVLTGTDLYRDLPASRRPSRSPSRACPSAGGVASGAAGAPSGTWSSSASWVAPDIWMQVVGNF